MNIHDDVWTRAEFKPEARPDEYSIISLNEFGDPLSYFGSFVWDFSPYIYHPGATKKINFTFEFPVGASEARNLLHEFKLMMYGLLFFETNSRSQSASLVVASKVYAQKLVELGAECNMTIDGIANKPFLFNRLKRFLSVKNRTYVKYFIGFLRKIAYLGAHFEFYNFSLSPSQFAELEELKNILSNDPNKQHLVIPSRIYALIFNSSEQILQDYLDHAKSLEPIFYKIFGMRFNLFNFNRNDKYKAARTLSLTVETLNLSKFCHKYSLKSARDFFVYFYAIRDICFARIVQMTGMRISETYILPHNALNFVNVKNKKIVLVNGFTGKLTKAGALKTTWISSNSIKLAMDVASCQMLVYCRLYQVSPSQYSEFPLFPTFGVKANSSLYEIGLPCNVHLSRSFEYFNVDLTIHESDFEELQRTQLLSDLSSYKVHIGSKFPLTSHQFRRSLAVYASKSSLVQTPALKAQLKHISTDMTYYYSNNSNFAPNFLFDSNLTEVFNEEMLITNLVGFKDDVLDSSSTLFGGEGTRLQIAKDSKNIPLFLTDIKETHKAMKEGSLTYRQTPLGGCSRKGSCDKIAILSITACIKCPDAVFSAKSIPALMSVRKNLLNRLSSLPAEQFHAKQIGLEIESIDHLLSKASQNNEVKNV